MECSSHSKILYPNDRLFLPAKGEQFALVGTFANADGKPGWISAMASPLHRTWSLAGGEKQEFYFAGGPNSQGTLIANTGSSPITITWKTIGTPQVAGVAC